MILKGKRILIVDDEQDLLDAMKMFFEMKGAKVVTATSGGMAYERWTKDKTIDMILSDVRMPGHEGDGITLTKKIRKEDPDLPIVLITGYSAETVSEALAAGANHMTSKPFKWNELEEKLKSLLESA